MPDKTQRKFDVAFEGGVIFVCCSDWYVNPFDFTDTDSRQLFVFQNFACHTDISSNYPRFSELEAIVDIIDREDIRNIVICGHFPCQSVDWAWSQINNGLLVKELLVEKYNIGNLPPSQKTSYANVLYLASLWKIEPAIQSRCEHKKITLHAWLYNTENEKMEVFCFQNNKFVPFQELRRVS